MDKKRSPRRGDLACTQRWMLALGEAVQLRPSGANVLPGRSCLPGRPAGQARAGPTVPPGAATAASGPV